MSNGYKSVLRLTLVFIIAVVLSGSILTWFSVSNISNLKKLMESRVHEELQELGSLFLNAMQARIDSLTEGLTEISVSDSTRNMLIEKTYQHDFVRLPFILDDQGSLLYPVFAGIQEPEEPYYPGVNFITTYKRGEMAEFRDRDLKSAIELYKDCLNKSGGERDSAKVLNALGRVALKSKQFGEAIKFYRQIVYEHIQVPDENGFPYAYYAVAQLIKIQYKDDSAQILPAVELFLQKLTFGEIELNYQTKDLLNGIRRWLSIIQSENGLDLDNTEELLRYSTELIQFQSVYSESLNNLIQSTNLENYPDVGNNFRLINSLPVNGMNFLLLTKARKESYGFLIDGDMLLNSLLRRNLQQDFEFSYHLQIESGFNSRLNNQNLTFSTQLNPYYPGKRLVMSLADYEAINNLIRNRSWIYGIASLLLLVAMLLGVALILRDISREKRLAGLRSDFISNVTHELKTPLTSIYMFAESMLLGRIKSPGVKNEYLSVILKESERLKRMINNILEFSKMEKGKSEYHMKNSNLSETVKSAIEDLDYWLEKEKFTVSVEMDEAIEVPIDREKMKQAFTNIISNAIKYSNDSKKIMIRVFNDVPYAVVEVEDRGVGIPNEKLNRIFEKFYRIDQKENVSGTGLGLTVVKEIIEAHKGRIEVSSEPGKGTKFSLFLNRNTA